jgi:hypothetical protein
MDAWRKFVANQRGRTIQAPAEQTFAAQVKWASFYRDPFAAGADLNFLRQGCAGDLMSGERFTLPSKSRRFLLEPVFQIT